MTGLLDLWPWLTGMTTLVLLSAIFSGSEAALFSLDQSSRQKLRAMGAAGSQADRLLNAPDQLLSAILFWNLLINMTYFAIAAIVGDRLGAQTESGASHAMFFTIASLLVIIFFSEMLPKSLAVISPVRIASLVGFPMTLAFQLVRPLLPLVTASNQLAGRLIWPTFEPEEKISLSDIERAIELGTGDAALIRRERAALRGLVEIAETRVTELMQPRTKLWLSSDLSNIDFQRAAHHSHLMVTNNAGDMIVSAIGIKSLRPTQFDQMKLNLEPVVYVPWSAYVSQVLDQLQSADCSVAVIVNEFGELAGAVTKDNILRFVMATREDDEVEIAWSIQEVADGVFRALGSVSVRSLAKKLEIVVEEEGVTTLLGLVQRQNGRFPREGDQAELGAYQLVVKNETEDGWLIEIHHTLDGQGDL
ncbi:MAG: CNNM domain-containing protein [Rubripirellula sp.]